jgi:hypothetical protein
MVQFRRQVELTVRHERKQVLATSSPTGTQRHYADVYVVTVVNKSPKRDVVVTRVWFETVPPVEIATASQLPIHLKPEVPWRKEVRAPSPDEPDAVSHLARCQLSPDDKIIKSRPAN